jgi:hypothetical protein
MPFFTVLTPPRGNMTPDEAAIEAEIVRDGFNWTAFALSGFWLLGKRLWLGFAAFAVVYMLWLWFRVELGLPSLSLFVVDLAIRLFIGHEASSLIERKRLRQGWDLADVVEAANLGHAERRFFGRHVAEYQAAPKPAAPLPRAPLPVTDTGIALFAEPRSR